MSIDTSTANVARLLQHAFLNDQGLRKEDVQKVSELSAYLATFAQLVKARSKKRPLVVVETCAGKSALSLLAAAAVLEPLQLPYRIIAIDNVIERKRLFDEAKDRLGIAHAEFVTSDVRQAALPHAPDLVWALHACGSATDDTLHSAIAAHAKNIWVVPCCYGSSDDARLSAWPLPRHGLVRRRLSAALIDTERTLLLESHGYQTEVVELFAPTVSPHALLWRAKRVGEPVRMAEHEALRHALHRPSGAAV